MLTENFVYFVAELFNLNSFLTKFFYRFIGNKDRLILYVTLTMGVGLVVFATALIARFVMIHVQYKRNNKPEIIPVSDDQFFSDSDLEQYEPPDNLPPPVINYTASLRRQSSDAQPRAPVADGSELNHYFS